VLCIGPQKTHCCFTSPLIRKDKELLPDITLGRNPTIQTNWRKQGKKQRHVI